MPRFRRIHIKSPSKMQNAKKNNLRKISKNLEYKKDLHNVFEEFEYSFTLIQKKLSIIHTYYILKVFEKVINFHSGGQTWYHFACRELSRLKFVS